MRYLLVAGFKVSSYVDPKFLSPILVQGVFCFQAPFDRVRKSRPGFFASHFSPLKGSGMSRRGADTVSPAGSCGRYGISWNLASNVRMVQHD
jgi:hypothetical protein